MPAFTTVFAAAALAGSLVQAAPLLSRGKPSTYYEPYLEPYDTYHLRYLAISCQTQHNTTFFEDCCHPLLSTETLADDRKPYCAPNATQIASASSYIASTSLYGVPTSSAAGEAKVASTPTSSAQAEEASVYSAAEVSASASASASSSKAAAPSTQANFAQQETSTSTYVAPTTTSTSVWVAPTTTSTYQAPATTTAASSNNGGGSVQSGGYATYFYQNGNPGACGNYNSDNAYIVAIDQAWWPNFGSQSQYCGRSLTIKNTNNGKTVSATVADVCPTCANGNSLDLSVGAFTAIASTGDGMVPIQWWWN